MHATMIEQNQQLSDSYYQATAIIAQLSKSEKSLIVQHILSSLFNQQTPETATETANNAWLLGQNLFGQVGSGNGSLSQTKHVQFSK